jgi:pimeloyl-ACP methyl ester carboxylesterase
MFGPAAALAAATLTVPAGDGAQLKAYVHPAKEAKAPVTLIVNGGPGLAHTTLDTLAPLATRGRTVVFFDQRGTGRSTAAGDDPADYGLAAQVADIEAIRRKLGVRKVSLLGHSFGGMFVAAYAAAHPSRVASLVLSDAVPLDPAPYVTGLQVIDKRLKALQQQGIIRDPLPPADGDDCTPTVQAKEPVFFADPSLAKGHAVFPDGVCNNSAQVRTAIGASDDERRATLSRLRRTWHGRTLVIAGKQEPFGRGWYTATRAEASATKRTALEVPGGHSPWLENPRWMKVVQRFLPGR